MIKTVILLVFLAFNGCFWECDDRPKPPYGEPDDVIDYNSDTYESITYVYYCLNGEYVSVTYSTEGCQYSKSVVKSVGVCR